MRSIAGAHNTICGSKKPLLRWSRRLRSAFAAQQREPVAVDRADREREAEIDSRGASDEYVRRGVFLARLTLAPRLSRVFRPRDDGDQPLTPLKGVIE